MTKPEQEVLDAPAKVAEYSAVDAGLAELRTKVEKTAYDITTTAGDKTARALRAECVSLRTSIEAKRVEAKAPLLAKGKLLDAEAKRITAEITAIETPIDTAIKAEEKRKADEKAAKDRAEAEARRKIDQAIADIAYYPVHASGKTADEIENLGVELAARALTEEEFGDRIGEAGIARSAALQKLRDMHAAAVAAQQQAEALRVQQAEAERVRQEQQAEAERINKARADLEQQQRDLAAQQEAVKPAPVATPIAATMQPPDHVDTTGVWVARATITREEAERMFPAQEASDVVSISPDLADASDTMPGADDMIEVIADYYDVPPFAAEAWLRAAFGG